MITYKQWRMVTVYSVAHFAVDFACAFLMFRNITGIENGYLCVLLYNFCAFALQMPLGIIADKWNRNYLFALVGCLLVGLSYGLLYFPIMAVTIAGIGNAMFHIGGGIDVLNISEEKRNALGIFVSPGAFGIYLGTLLGKGSGVFSILFPLLLIIMAGLIYMLHRVQGKAHPENAMLSLKEISSKQALLVAACLFLVVCLRSYAGLAQNFSWKGTGYGSVALICAVVFGKTIGGFAADRFGLMKTSLVSLCFAALLFYFSHIPISGIMAVLLFNMTMPITLWVMAKILPGAKGFSFGLLTFALFLGFLPVYLDVNAPDNAALLFSLLTVVSLGIMMIGLRKAKL